MARTIALVACVSKKNKTPMAAQELYISPWFKKASKYARSITDDWYILSAKYGMVSPTRIIEPYNETLNHMAASERRAWAQKTLEELSMKLIPGDTVVILAGLKYREHLERSIQDMGCLVKIPMEGLAIGKQLQWLTRNINYEVE